MPIFLFYPLKIIFRSQIEDDLTPGSGGKEKIFFYLPLFRFAVKVFDLLLFRYDVIS